MALNITPNDITRALVNAAVEQVPGPPGKLVGWIVDNFIFPEFIDKLIFPKPAEDLFDQFKDRVQKMLDQQIGAAVGQATFDRVKARLTGLGNAFQAFAHVVDFEERKTRLAYVLTLADATVTDVEAVPDRYLYLLADTMKLTAALHIAVLHDQVRMFPDYYEHQLALNKAAIRYSDLAGRIRDRFLWYRLGQIADAKGVIQEQDVEKRQLSGKPLEKRVRFTAYDDFAQWWANPYGYRTQFLVDVTT